MRVWYGTNRKPVADSDPSQGFSAERDQRVHLGQCRVLVPKSHKFGSIGTPWWRRWLRFEFHSDALELRRVSAFAPDEFWAKLEESLAADPDVSHVLVFLHGYNTTFEEAAVRAAQLGVDLEIRGAVAFFSWPSTGGVRDYLVDEATVEASEPYITEFLRNIAARAGATRVHVVAHSMGNRALLRSFQRIATTTAATTPIRFGQVILAAPDVDVDTFKNLARVYEDLSSRTTLYVSPSDIAVQASSWLHKYPRVGFSPPVTIVPGVETVEVPAFNLLNLGHGYFAEAGALLHDMFDLIRRNPHPDDRQRLARHSTGDGSYWVMRR